MSEYKSVPDDFLPTFLKKHRLPGGFAALATRWYLPLCEWLMLKQPRALGINGGQGSGKSTLADFIADYYELQGKQVAVLSIDDIYRTKMERDTLATKVHPLLATRGVPGTHDVGLGIELVQKLQKLGQGESIELPVFNKAIDDRAATGKRYTGPIDLVILEGWCVASVPETEQALAVDSNALETSEDAAGKWRRHVNEQLAGDYQTLFGLIDTLVMLKVPSFEQVYQWRTEQEDKLEQKTGKRGMNAVQLQRFIQHYERLTRWNLKSLPPRADVVFELNAAHDIESGKRGSTEL